MTEKEIRQSIKKELSAGADSVLAEDLIDEYLRLRKLRNQLDRDISARGVSFHTVSSTGVPVQKQNPSLKDRLAVSRQMTAVLNCLGLGAEDKLASEETPLGRAEQKGRELSADL